MYFIQNFLRERYFRVTIGSSVSSHRIIETGIPQGSVLSVTLFLVIINEVTKAIPTHTKILLYADDLTIYHSDDTVEKNRVKLLESTDAIVQWMDDNGFCLAQNKTKIVNFTKRRKNNSTVIRIKGTDKLTENQVKYLGITLDHHLTWEEHVKQIKAVTGRKLCVMKTLAELEWGSERKMLLNIIIYTKHTYDHHLNMVAHYSKCSPKANQ